MAYAKPSSVTRINTNGGRWHGGGVDYTIKGKTNYFVYVQDPSTYKYWKKGKISSSSGLTVNIGANKTGSSFSTAIILSDTDQGDSCTVGNEYSSNLYWVTVPLFIAKIYRADLGASWYNSSDHPNLSSVLSYTGYSFGGLTSSSSSYEADYGADWDTYGAQIDAYGSTNYAIYYKNASTSTSTGYYYRGSNSKKSVTITTTTAKKYLYGKGSTSGGSISTSVGSMTKSCLSDSSYSFHAWTTSPISSSGSGSFYAYAEDAFEESNTIYGLYVKEGSTTTSNAYYYRGTNSQKSVTKTTTTTDSEYYGTGQHIAGTTTVSYDTPTSSHASDASWEFQGWATSPDSSTIYSTSATTAWKNSNTIYGVYSKTDSMDYYPQNTITTKQTVSTTNYAYGIGSTTSNIPTEPSLTYDGYNFQGWAISSTEAPSTWTALWNNGTRTVYAIWKISTIPIQIHNGTKYVNYAIYIHNGTEYVKVIPHVHNGTMWKQLKSQ